MHKKLRKQARRNRPRQKLPRYKKNRKLRQKLFLRQNRRRGRNGLRQAGTTAVDAGVGDAADVDEAEKAANKR